MPPPSLKDIIQQWKMRILKAVCQEPTLAEAADILGYGAIVLSVDQGKITYVELDPKLRLNRTANSAT